MPQPTPDWDMVEIRGKLTGTDGKPVKGRIKFTPKASRLKDLDRLTTLIGRTVIATLVEVVTDETTGAGYSTFTIFLPATDDPDITPNGFTFTVAEEFDGSVPAYDIVVPLSAKPAGLDYTIISAEGASQPGTPSYVAEVLTARAQALEAAEAAAGSATDADASRSAAHDSEVAADTSADAASALALAAASSATAANASRVAAAASALQAATDRGDVEAMRDAVVALVGAAEALAVTTDGLIAARFTDYTSLSRAVLNKIATKVYSVMDPRWQAAGPVDPTGATDSYAALQACFDQAFADGANVYAPFGTYKHTETLTIKVRQFWGSGQHAGSAGAGTNFVFAPVVAGGDYSAIDLKPAMNITAGTQGSRFAHFTVTGPHGAMTVDANLACPTPSLLPRYTAFAPGIAGVKVSNAAQPTFEFVRTTGVKVGLLMASTGGHISSLHCNWSGVFGVFNSYNSGDYWFEGGTIVGTFAGYLFGSGFSNTDPRSGTSATLRRVHMGFAPYSFYQAQTLDDAHQGGNPLGAQLDLRAVRFEQTGEAIIKTLPTATGNAIGGDGVGVTWSNPADPLDGTSWSNVLPNEIIPSGQKQMWLFDLGRVQSFAWDNIGGNGGLFKSGFQPLGGVLRATSWDGGDGDPFLAPGVPDEQISIAGIGAQARDLPAFSTRNVEPRALRNRQGVAPLGGNLLNDPENAASWLVLGAAGPVVTTMTLAAALAEINVARAAAGQSALDGLPDVVGSHINWDYDVKVVKVTPNGIAPNLALRLSTYPLAYEGPLAYSMAWYGPKMLTSVAAGAGATSLGTVNETAAGTAAGWHFRKVQRIRNSGAAGAANARSYFQLSFPAGMSTTEPTYLLGVQLTRGPAERPYARTLQPFARKGIALEKPDGTLGLATMANDGSVGTVPGVPRLVAKAVNTIANNTAARVTDPELVMTGVQPGVYKMDLYLAYSAATTADLKFEIERKDGAVATARYGGVPALSFAASAATGAFDAGSQTHASTPTLGGTGVASVVNGVVTGLLTVTTAGTIAFKWAQGTAEATDTTLYAGSYFQLTKVTG